MGLVLFLKTVLCILNIVSFKIIDVLDFWALSTHSCTDVEYLSRAGVGNLFLKEVGSIAKLFSW